jgi:hypothetical protein
MVDEKGNHCKAIPVKRNLDLAFGVSRLLILQFAFISKKSKASLHPLVKIEGIKE